MSLDQAFEAELLKLGNERTFEWAMSDELRKLGLDFKDDATPSPPPTSTEPAVLPDPKKPIAERIEKKALSFGKVLEALMKRKGATGSTISRSSLYKALKGVKGEFKPKTLAHDLVRKEVSFTRKHFQKKAHIMLPNESKLPQPDPGGAEPSEDLSGLKTQNRQKMWKRLGMLSDDVVLTAKNLLRDWHEVPPV